MPLRLNDSLHFFFGVAVTTIFNCFLFGLIVSCPAYLFAQSEFKLTQKQFEQTIKPLLAKHCGECHSGADANAGINFDEYQAIDNILDDDQKWETIAAQIKAGEMPPEDYEPLNPKDKPRLVDWIRSTLDLISCENSYPGVVTIRKLNRREYRNTIRDLLGVDVPAADDFPGDDVGYGFDNIADVLSLPPLLMDKYLDAAEIIAARAIPATGPLDLEIAGSNFKHQSKTNRVASGVLYMLTKDTAELELDFDSPGIYAFVVQAYGTRANGEYPQMTVLVDDQAIKTVEVQAVRRKPAWHGFKLDLGTAGAKRLQIRFENDFYEPRPIGSQDRNLYISKVVIRGPQKIDSPLGYLNFDDQSREEAQRFIEEFLPRAFRSTVSASQTKRFVQLFDSFVAAGDSFPLALQKVLQAVLISPQFLYKLEKPVEPDQTRELDSFERATSLTYFLWSSTPDDQLLALARQNRLLDAEVWAEQIRRVLDNPKSQALIDDFFAQWLNLELLSDLRPDPRSFPQVDAVLLRDMQTETKMLIADVLRNDGSLFDLLQSEFTYLNPRLAQHYSAEALPSDGFVKVKSPPQRSGLLTHASFLTLTSNPTRTSPVKRGKWIMENILGIDPPPPLANVIPLEDQDSSAGSLRERMRIHRTDPSCASCHATMDALGFALEHYDGSGKFRNHDNGFDIDARSELPDGVVLEGAVGLQNVLSTTYQEKVVRCFAEKLLTYAIGRGLRYFDRCAIDKIVARAKAGEYRISEFIKAVAESEPFLHRGTRKIGVQD